MALYSVRRTYHLNYQRTRRHRMNTPTSVAPAHNFMFMICSISSSSSSHGLLAYQIPKYLPRCTLLEFCQLARRPFNYHRCSPELTVFSRGTRWSFFCISFRAFYWDNFLRWSIRSIHLVRLLLCRTFTLSEARAIQISPSFRQTCEDDIHHLCGNAAICEVPNH
jgi:hypothetical protein